MVGHDMCIFLPSGTILKVVQKSLIYIFVMKLYFDEWLAKYLSYLDFIETGRALESVVFPLPQKVKDTAMERADFAPFSP